MTAAPDPRTPDAAHEPTCAYYGLPFKPGSANRICPCPGRTPDAARGEEPDTEAPPPRRRCSICAFYHHNGTGRSKDCTL